MKELNLDAFLTSEFPATLFSLLTDGLCVTGIELPELDEDNAAWFGKRSVSSSGRIAQVASGWVVPMLIGEDALQHKNLFTTSVRVDSKVATRSITHNARCSQLPFLGGPVGVAPLQQLVKATRAFFQYAKSLAVKNQCAVPYLTLLLKSAGLLELYTSTVV